MWINRIKQVVVVAVCCSLVYSPLYAQQQLALPANDFDAPKIEHSPLNESFQAGVVKPITAKVTDDVAVKSVVLYYRQIGSERFQQANFRRVGNSDEYSVELEPIYYTPPGIEYYIQATDTAGNGLLVGSSFSPMKLAIENGSTPPAPTVGQTKTAPQSAALDLDKKSGSITNNKWLWIGLGVLAVGLITSGSDDGSNPPAKTGTVEISGNTP